MQDEPEDLEPILDTAGLPSFDVDDDMPVNPDMPVEEDL